MTMFVVDTSQVTHSKKCSVNYGKIKWDLLYTCTTKKTMLCLDLGVNIDEMEGACGHSCEKCGYLVNGDEAFNIFHNHSNLEDNLAKEVKMALLAMLLGMIL